MEKARKDAAHRRPCEAGQVELVLLLQASLVDVGQAVDGAKAQHAHADGDHGLGVATRLAVAKPHQQHEAAGDEAVDLVVLERLQLVQVGDLVGAHAKVGKEQQQRSHREGHGEQARLLGAHKPGADHRQKRKEASPGSLARRVEHVVAGGLVRQVLLALVLQATAKDGAQKAVPPVVDRAGEKPGLLLLGRRLARSPRARGPPARAPQPSQAPGHAAPGLHAVARGLARGSRRGDGRVGRASPLGNLRHVGGLLI